MKKYRKGFYGILLLTLTMLFGMTAQAKTDDTIKTGIYAGDVELSGMTAQEATAVIEEHIESLKDVEITLLAANDHDVTATAGDLGVIWKNPELVQEGGEGGKEAVGKGLAVDAADDFVGRESVARLEVRAERGGELPLQHIAHEAAAQHGPAALVAEDEAERRHVGGELSVDVETAVASCAVIPDNSTSPA